MNLVLVQHAEARPKAEDPNRSISEAGAEATRRMAAWAATAGLQVDRVQHSGKLRAEQTAQILAEDLKPDKGVIATPGLNPNDDVRPMAKTVNATEEAIMLVGHMPFMSRLASLLLAGEPEAGVVDFKTSGIVGLSRSEGEWSLSWAVTPELVAGTD
jgi:phosphohistidine phosphatase